MCKRLCEWQELRGVSDDDLADKVGVNRTTLVRAKKGQTLLSLETQIAIRGETDGHVQLADWAEHFEQTSAAREEFQRARRERESEENGAAA